MKAVVSISCYHFAFASAAQASKVVEALSKAVQCEHDYVGGKEIFSPAGEEGHQAAVALRLVPDDRFILAPRVPKARRLPGAGEDSDFLARLTGGDRG